MAHGFEQRAERVREVAIVVDDEQPAPRRRRARELLFHQATRDAALERERQANNEFAALAQSAARGGNRAAMHLDQPLHQRKADAQSSFGAVERTVALHEEVEHLGQ